MGSVRKASAWLGLVDDSEMRYYDDYAEEAGQEPEPGDAVRDAWATDPRIRATAADAQDAGTRIATITPDGFRDARHIGELFREGVPVIVNLTAMESSDAKRVIDFAAGLTFGLRGSIERVANRVFLLTPNAYQILSGQDRRPAEGGFFNQS
ncbi:cell division protein SepF [Streptomyces sp. JJ38]|uniref:cell division protein SepF n=1 Tax=Streptomyces sp. JJ38 TaxID=2738128 RepID=UPI001C59F9C4|nr:cell division protein SepF [Streptomyces sp. JJ38]MBW1599258.1 cell division protein SepF [Streptomyces sp. JJ38]